MMRTILTLVCLLAATALLAGQEQKYEKDWREFRMPPFEVLAERDNDDVRAFLADLYQFRHLLENALPGKELRAQWPIRIWLLDDRTLAAAPLTEPIPVLVDRYVVVLGRPPRLTNELQYRLAERLLRDNLRPMPTWFENGLLALLGGARIEGQAITLGEPATAGLRTMDWARVYTLLVNKESVPVLSALTGNLEKGMEARLALRNSYRLEMPALDAAAKTVLAGGALRTVYFSGLAVNPNTDFRDEYLPLGYDVIARLSMAATRQGQPALGRSIAAARPGLEEMDVRARVQVQAMDAIRALENGEREEAGKILGTLTAVGVTQSPRVYLEAARLANSAAEQRRLAEMALERNPGWAEVHRFLAGLEKDPKARANELYTAAERDPRNQGLWEEAAKALAAADDFSRADAALSGAERSATNPDEQQRLRDERWRLREERASREEELRQAKLAEERAAMEKLKAKTMSRIEEALAKANAANAPAEPIDTVVDYDEQDRNQSVEGRLRRVLCRSTANSYILELQGEQAPVKILLPDASKVAIEGGGKLAFTCGAQPEGPVLSVSYLPKEDATLGTIGEAKTIRVQ